MRVRRGSLVVMLAITLLGCGGGGGGSSLSAPPAPLQVTGNLYLTDPSGYSSLAPAGREVRLVALDTAANATQVLASTTTGNDGTYRLTVPQDRQYGDALALETADTDGQQLRALVFGPSQEIGPASEAVTRAYLDARASSGNSTLESVARLYRWQIATTTFLALTPYAANSSSNAAVAELGDWLDDDLATRDSLRALRTERRLPSTLGDIGGLYGLGTGAWVVADSSGITRHVVVRPVASPPGTFGYFSGTIQSPPSVSSQPTHLVQFSADGVAQAAVTVPDGTDATSTYLLHVIGPTRLAQIGLANGETVRLNEVRSNIQGNLFDRDPNVDVLTYTHDVTATGYRTIQHFGAATRALLMTSNETLEIDLSGGGRIRSEVRRLQWCIPLAGCVRTEATVTATGAQGQSSSASSWQELNRGVLNEVSWPGRLRAFATTVAVPSAERDYAPAAIGPQRTLTLITGRGNDSPLSARVVDIDSGAVRSSVDLPTPADGLDAFWRLSPDRTRMYAVHSRRSPSAAGSFGDQAMPLAEASAAGALVLRFDASTLAEERRLTLPAQPSARVAGGGFPRNTVNGFLVSPKDPTHFIAESFGAVLIRDDAPAQDTFIDPGTEFPGGSGRMLLKLHADLRAWDGDADELHLYYRPLLGEYRPLIVPIQPNGLRLAQARPGFDPMSPSGAIVTMPTQDDRFVGDRLYVLNYTYALDKSNGLGLAESVELPGISVSSPQTRCDRDAVQLVCWDGATLPGGSLVELDPDTLRIIDQIELQNDLRFLAHGHYPARIQGLYRIGAGEFVAATTTAMYPTLPYRIYRLKHRFSR